MEITYRGTVPGERKWYGRCDSCDSRAIAKESELKNITRSLRDGSFAWQICPVCKAGDINTGYGGMLFDLEDKYNDSDSDNDKGK